MNFLAYGPVIGIASLLAVDATGVLPAIAPEMLQGGALAVLAWVIWYVLARVFPAQVKAQRDQRDAFLKFLAERLDDHND